MTAKTITQQIIDDLRGQIASGELAVGDRLPSTAALCQQYNASTTPVHNAVMQLKVLGLVEGVPGKGVFVADGAADKAAGKA